MAQRIKGEAALENAKVLEARNHHYAMRPFMDRPHSVDQFYVSRDGDIEDADTYDEATRL